MAGIHWQEGEGEGVGVSAIVQCEIFRCTISVRNSIISQVKDAVGFGSNMRIAKTHE